jgi:hypothetical protein
MTSALWVATCGVPITAISAAIPPACRRAVDVLPASTSGPDEDEILVEAPTWAVAGAADFVASFAAITRTPYSVRLELSARIGGAWSGWVAGVALGPTTFAPLPPTDGLDVDVDVIRARSPVEAVRARARVRGPAPASVLAAPWMLTLSAADPSSATPAGALERAARPIRLDVPALSQMEADAAIASRICSPTCVAMVLGYWRHAVSLAALAADIFHPGVDLYGVWPAAIVAAGRRGLAGYLLRFPDWASAAWCLREGLPVIASVRYAAGELTGSAIPATSGHLVVLTGLDGDDVLVNDPAAPTAAGVPRRYPLAELADIWLTRTALGYVLFPPTSRPELPPGTVRDRPTL